MSNKNRNTAKQIERISPAIDEVFSFRNKKYKCVESHYECDGCVFEEQALEPDCACYKLSCLGEARKDKKCVTFKEVE